MQAFLQLKNWPLMFVLAKAKAHPAQNSQHIPAVVCLPTRTLIRPDSRPHLHSCELRHILLCCTAAAREPNFPLALSLFIRALLFRVKQLSSSLINHVGSLDVKCNKDDKIAWEILVSIQTARALLQLFALYSQHVHMMQPTLRDAQSPNL